VTDFGLHRPRTIGASMSVKDKGNFSAASSTGVITIANTSIIQQDTPPPESPANADCRNKNDASTSSESPERKKSLHLQCEALTAKGLRCHRTVDSENFHSSLMLSSWRCFQHAVKCSKSQCKGVFSDPNWLFCPICTSRPSLLPASTAKEAAIALIDLEAASNELKAVEKRAKEFAQHTQNLEYRECLLRLSMAFWRRQYLAWRAAEKAEEKKAAIAATAQVAASGAEAATTAISVTSS